ncbi:MAG: methionine--tRNA ligase [Bdellovibrionales bacterium]|nr:methionine--tRNA ligase [Bdellovibrionales bacterium]
MTERFYITTAIDYPNGSPHMGHAYEKTVTDCYARWYRMMGREVRFLTGTDENGQKLMEAAKTAGAKSTMSYVDENVKIFRSLCDAEGPHALNLSNDDFIRTTEDRHKATCTRLWNLLEKAGDIHFDRYSGDYCLDCEAFYTKVQAPEGVCPNHGKALSKKEEDGYFFRMSRYEGWIKEFLRANPTFIVPEGARKELLSRLDQEPLRDLSISRPSEGWGIPIPSNPKYVMYTWFDALINYLAAVDTDTLRFWWPASVHVIGRDIAWFHCVIWPIMLHAAGIELPKQVYVHGMVLGQDGRKMSKSLGNGVDPFQMLEKYGGESFRYFILRAISSTQDGPFVEKDLVARHNNELANDYGNLLMRVVKFAEKKLGTTLARGEAKQEITFQETLARMQEHMDHREHHRAIDALWEKVAEANQYINTTAPWSIKDNPARLHEVIYNALHAIHCLGNLISPFLPITGARTLASLGTSADGPAGIIFGSQVFKLSTPEALFPKIETAPKGTPA